MILCITIYTIKQRQNLNEHKKYIFTILEIYGLAFCVLSVFRVTPKGWFGKK